MGYYALIGKLDHAVRLLSPSQDAIFDQFLLRCDDYDDEEKGMERGRNSFPSIQTVSRAVGISTRNVRKNVSIMIDAGLIREFPTKRYRQSMKKQSGSSPLCREVNLSMLARLVDVRTLIDAWRILPEDPRYKALILAALVFRPDDWITRLWHAEYTARDLDWDGTVDSISPSLWDVKDTPKESESPLDDGNIQGTISEEELEVYTNKYRIDL